MSRLLLSFLFLILSAFAFAQDNLVVTQKGDTLRGEVRILSYDLVDRIQLIEGKKKLNYTALQVRRATMDGEQFVPVQFENSVRMMKVIRSGFLSLYAYRAPGQAGYDTRVLQKVGGKSIEVPNIGFKKFVGDIVAECPVVAEKIKEGDLGRKDVEKLVDEYNLCIEENNGRRTVVASEPNNPVTEIIEKIRSNVTASDLSNKNDIDELLNSIADRYKKKESVPAYMKEGLKSYLVGRDDFKSDLEQLFNLVEKQ